MNGAISHIIFIVIMAATLHSAGSSSNAKPVEIAMGLSPTTGHIAETEVQTIPGMPPVIDPTNIYSETTADKLAPALKNLLPRVYVPNEWDGTVTIIDPAAFKVVDKFRTGKGPQHVVPSWDMKQLWVVNNESSTLTPINPETGKPGASVRVSDPYNMYFTPDGKYAVIVAEARHRLDFRDPQTMSLRFSVEADCRGINHMDFSIDGSYAVASCEFSGKVIKIDMKKHKLIGALDLGLDSMPQDVRLSPDGKTFYIADMMANGVHLITGNTFNKIGFIPTGKGAHGLIPSRNGKLLYVSNRGWSTLHAGHHGQGSVSVIDFSTNKVVANWPIPGGGSPDMGNVSIDGDQLWLSGRYDDEVYCFDTTTGRLIARIPVGERPHGLAYWPLPGRYSLGHTGNMR